MLGAIQIYKHVEIGLTYEGVELLKNRVGIDNRLGRKVENEIRKSKSLLDNRETTNC
jgi:hypothetical protein